MELQAIQDKIYEIRGRRVMLDFDLAALYNVETRTLKQAVRRNIERFPDDFLLKLSPDEANHLIDIGRSQNVIPPGYNVGASEMFAFTEHGVAMLSSVLRSGTAIQMNIAIMRAFVAVRLRIAATEAIAVEFAEIRAKIDLLERNDEVLAQNDELIARDGEETLRNLNDLSEDIRKHIDNLYNAVGELSVKSIQVEKPRRRIGY